MPDNIPTKEEQKQITRIVRRWMLRNQRSMLVLISAVTLFWLFFNTLNPNTFSSIMVGFFIVHFIVYRMAFRKAARNFVRRLSPTERELITSKQTEYTGQSRIIESLLRANHIKPEREYLRASVKDEDETLLRAAASIEATAQDQLLRPTNPNDNVTP